MAASAVPATAVSCAPACRTRIVVLPQFTWTSKPDEPVCAKVNRTSIRSPGFKPAAGTSHPPRLVHAAPLVDEPAALQITCAAAARTGAAAMSALTLPDAS